MAKTQCSHIIGNKQCKNTYISQNIFCHVHNKQLDTRFGHNLMGIYDSFVEISYDDLIYLDNQLFVLDLILNHYTYQLNNSNMENPYPIYPNDPFTRNRLSINGLMKLKNKLITLKKPINIALKTLLNLEPIVLQQIHDNLGNDNFSIDLLSILNTSYRYMIINTKNSQDIFTGLWVSKECPLTMFEKLHKKLNNTSYQIMSSGQVVSNGQRNKIECKMSKCQTYNDMFDLKKYVIMG